MSYMDERMFRQVRNIEEEINRIHNEIANSADIVGGVTDHNYLSNRGTIGHSSLDILYNRFDFTGTASGTILWFNGTTSHYEPHAVGTASHLLICGTNSPYYGIPVWAASAYSMAFVAYSQVYVVASTASVHYAATASFHGFSVASHEAGRILYDDGTNFVAFPVGTASYVFTQGSGSPYWKAPSSNPIAPVLMAQGTFNGWADYTIGPYGALCVATVLHSDADAGLCATWRVASGGSFKFQLNHRSDTGSRTDNGTWYASAYSPGGSDELKTLMDGVAMNIVNTASNTLYCSTSSAVTIGDGTVVSAAWQKSNNAGTGNLYAYGLSLERQ